MTTDHRSRGWMRTEEAGAADEDREDRAKADGTGGRTEVQTATCVWRNADDDRPRRGWMTGVGGAWMMIEDLGGIWTMIDFSRARCR